MNGEVQAIDWGAPIEAYHSDGRVVAVTYNGPSSIPTECQVRPLLDTYHHVFMRDGRSVSPVSGWRIRNVTTPPAPPQGIAPEVVERALALVKAVACNICATFGHASYLVPRDQIDEARAIVALLEPVDPAKAYVERVFRGISDGGLMSDKRVKWMMEEAFKAGSLAEQGRMA